MNTAPGCTPTGRTPTLHAVQQQMAALILAGTRLDTPTSSAAAIDALIAAPDRGDAPERMRIYAGGYAARIEEALQEAFPAVAHIVGAGAFHDLVHRYIEVIPLHSYNLNDAGAELPRFLSTDGLTEGLPFLPDLARLEWQIARAFHAHDQAPFDPTPMADWDLDEWERVVLRFQPWVALVTSDWPVREIWECRETPIAEIDLDLSNRPDRVLVRRSGYAVVCESLDAPEADALGALLEGRALGSVVSALTARGDDAASVSAWFARWMALRVVADCELTNADDETRIG